MERLLPCLLRASPSPNSHLRYIRSDCRILSIKMLASQLENADDKQHSVQVAKEDLSIEQEIECPSDDAMTLHSEFDRLGYLCEERDFSLHLTH
jgi:hypothetical protein